MCRFFLTSLTTSLLLLIISCSAPTPPAAICQDCNVILVLADTLRADHLGVYGYPRPTSPRLDRRARSAIRFSQARSQASCTFPSMNSLLTSRHTFQFMDATTRPTIPPSVPTLPALLRDRGFATAAVSASPIVRRSPGKHNPKGGFGGGFQSFDESCEWQDAGCVTERATALLDELAEPFFLYLHYMDPHDPYRPEEDLRGTFSQPYEEGPRYIARGNPNPVRQLIRDQKVDQHLDASDFAHLRDLYDEEILSLDRSLGGLFDELDRRQLSERTLVILASDHGEGFYEHGTVKHCYSVYDVETRVPLLFWIPGIEGPVERHAAVQNLDILPTVMDYLGLLDDSLPEIAGHSLRPIIESSAVGGGLAYSAAGAYRSVNDERHKLILDLAAQSYQLFDLLEDPQELRDLLPERRPQFHRLRQELESWSRSAEGGEALERRLDRAREIELELRALGYLG